MKRSVLLKNEPCSMPDCGQDEVTAASQIVAAGEGLAVEISLFYKGSLRGRYFADRENHSAWVDGKWNTCRLDNVARMCMDMTPLKGDYYYEGNCLKWASDEDKNRALDFLDTWSIDNYEQRLSGRKRHQAMKRKMERIEKQMSEVPCVPDEAEQWLDQKIFPGHILFIKKEKNRTTYSCTACGQSGWKKKGWKHGEKTVCPKCGEKVTANSRSQEKEQKAPVVILQQYADKWIERQFRAVCRWTRKEKEISLFEEIRAIIPQGKQWGKVWYGTLYEQDEFGQEFWDKNQSNKRFLSSYLYPGGLKEVLEFGGMERSGMDIMAAKGEKFNVNNFIINFQIRPWIEYLTKAGLTRLTAEITDKYGQWGNPNEIYTYAHSLKGALKIDGNRVNRMKQINGGLGTLEWLQYEEKEDTKITQESLSYLQAKGVRVDECRDILKELKSVNRMVNYMKKQKVPPKKLAITWRDYLRMAKAEGYDTTDDIVRFPKDLKARHDYLVELGNKRKDEERLKEYAELDARIRKMLPQVRRYYWQDDTYVIIPAGSCSELMEEGRALHHCVGRDDHYMKKMADGLYWILFLRKKENIEEPYYTIEIRMKDDNIIQYYSSYDRKPDRETVSKILSKFKKSIRRPRMAATA